MPIYYFHLLNHDTIPDTDGTDLANDSAAYDHAVTVARELMFRSKGVLKQRWVAWRISVHNDTGAEVFALPMADVRSTGDGGQMPVESGRFSPGRK